jgi:hypothetical protein
MSGREAVVCEKLPLHTYAGTLAITPASAGQQSQQPIRRETTTTSWGTPNKPKYSGDEEYTNIRVTGTAGQRPHTELVIRMLGFSSSNAGNNPWGMGGVDYASVTSTVMRMLKAVSDTHSSLHMIQEHKLGKYVYASPTAFDGNQNEQWQWLAWPGKGVRQQGLAALISIEHVVEHKHRVAGLQCEIAYVGLDL